MIEKSKGWIKQGSLLYRLTDSRRPENRDEIRVTMADFSRSEEACSRRSGELFDLICSSQPTQEIEELFTNIDHAISSGAWNVQKGSQTWEIIQEAKHACGYKD